MKFIKKYRQDKEDELVEESINALYTKVCDAAAEQADADTYAIKVQSPRLNEKSKDIVVEKLRLKFRADDVIADLFFSGTELCGTIKPVPVPTQETYEVRMFWSRAPGKFVNKLNGNPVNLASSLSVGPVFTGSVREWYETLVETIIDAANSLHRVHLVAPNKVFVGPDALCMLEAGVFYHPNSNELSDSCGTLTNRFKVYKSDRLRNEIEVCLDLGDERYIAIVTILDMNII